MEDIRDNSNTWESLDKLVKFFIPNLQHEFDIPSPDISNIMMIQNEISMINQKPQNILQLLNNHPKPIFKCILKKHENKRRKWSRDSINKKIRRFFFNFLQKYFQSLFLIKSPPIPRCIIINATKKFNKVLFIQKVHDFYINYCNLNLFDSKLNIDDLNKVLFFDSSISNFFSFYLLIQFQNDLDILKKKESVKYIEKFILKSMKLCDYYKN